MGNGQSVAALAPLPARRAGVPGALRARNELDQLAIAPDQEMRRHVEVAQGPVVRVGGGIEELVNSRTTASPPNSPGGRLMLCTTSSVTGECPGRSSKLGEGT